MSNGLLHIHLATATQAERVRRTHRQPGRPARSARASVARAGWAKPSFQGRLSRRWRSSGASVA